MNLDAIRRRTSQLTPHLQRAMGEAAAQVSSGVDRAVANVNIGMDRAAAGMDRAAAQVASGVDRVRSSVAHAQASQSNAPAVTPPGTPSHKFPSLTLSSADAAPAVEAPEAIDVRICTWNIHGSPIDPADDIGQWVAPRGPPAALYVIGVQELVDLNPRSFVMNMAGNDHRQASLEDRVEEALRKKGREFTKVCSFGMVGLALLCYVDTSLVSLVSEVDCDRVKTAFEGVGGNKGAVCMRLRFGPISFCFINLHLPSGQHAAADRDQHMGTILSDAFQSVSSIRGSTRPSKLEFQRRSIYQAERHDFIAVFGDFNFRLSFPDGFTPPGPPEVWLEKDERLRGQAPRLRSFEEGPIVFPPTFKYVPGTDNFNQNRCPAWCDRVLYKSTPGIGVQLMEYDSVGDVRHTSDHRPVVASFRIPAKRGPVPSPQPGARAGAEPLPRPQGRREAQPAPMMAEEAGAGHGEAVQAPAPARFQPPAREPQPPQEQTQEQALHSEVPQSGSPSSPTVLGVDVAHVAAVKGGQAAGEEEDQQPIPAVPAGTLVKPSPPLETVPTSGASPGPGPRPLGEGAPSQEEAAPAGGADVSGEAEAEVAESPARPLQQGQAQPQQEADHERQEPQPLDEQLDAKSPVRGPDGDPELDRATRDGDDYAMAARGTGTGAAPPAQPSSVEQAAPQSEPTAAGVEERRGPPPQAPPSNVDEASSQSEPAAGSTDGGPPPQAPPSNVDEAAPQSEPAAGSTDGGPPPQAPPSNVDEAAPQSEPAAGSTDGGAPPAACPTEPADRSTDGGAPPPAPPSSDDQAAPQSEPAAGSTDEGPSEALSVAAGSAQEVASAAPAQDGAPNDAAPPAPPAGESEAAS